MTRQRKRAEAEAGGEIGPAKPQSTRNGPFRLNSRRKLSILGC